MMDRQITLTLDERARIFRALHLWSNYIETKNVNYSADVARDLGKEVRDLDADHIKLVEELKELADKVLLYRLWRKAR